MTFIAKRARASIAVLSIAAAAAALLVFAARGRSDSTPIGPVPAGPVVTTTTTPGQLVAVALPHASSGSGLVWRVARRFDPHVVRQVSEGDLGSNVVLVFKIVGRGKTSLVFALTRGDSSPKAVKAVTHKIQAR